MIVAVYLRKSRAEELTDSTQQTLSRHREALSQLCAERGFDIGGIYEEVISGDGLYARTQMLRLLSDIEIKSYGAVVCMDIDRLGRGAMSEQGIILETLKAHGVRIITPRKDYDLDDELDEEYTEFESFMARRELKMIKRRMRRGIKKTVQDGGFISLPPYGYRRELAGKRPTLRIDEGEAAFVKLMFRLYTQEGLGCQSVADTVNAAGARTRKGGMFSRTSVRHILTNAVYIGKIVWDKSTRLGKGVKSGKISANPRDKWTVAKGLHPAIIEDGVFLRAQEIMRSRANPPAGKKRGIQNPLAGFVLCKSCGARMQRRGASSGDMLACPTRSCMRAARLDAVHDAVLDAIDPLLGSFTVSCAGTRKEPELKEAFSSSKRELSELRRQKERLYELFERGIYDESLFKRRISEIEERIQKAVSVSNALELELNAPEYAEKKSVRELYALADAGHKNLILKTVIERIEYLRQGDCIELTIYLYDIFR